MKRFHKNRKNTTNMTIDLRLIVGIVTCLVLFSGNNVAQTTADVPPSKLPNSLLWRIVTQKGDSSYVFGTIHAPDTNVFVIRDTVLQLIAQSRAYASELNLDSIFSQMMNPSILMMDGKTLYNLYDSATVHEICTRLGQVASSLEVMCPHLKPGVIGMMIMMQSMDKTAKTSLDEFLWGKSRKSTVRRVGLETVAEQLVALDEQPPEALLELIRGTDSSTQQLETLTRYYVNEQLDSLDAAARDTAFSKGADLSSLNDKRNKRFVQRMIPLINDGGAFIAVGALHLAGPSSILSLLRKEGYSVEPVMGGRKRNVLTN